jgi:DNA mismatch repair protein MSH6
MAPENIRDRDRKRPDDEEYDGSTCYIPPEWFKKERISDGQRQWWDFKAKNWDSVLLFKMGKCDSERSAGRVA